MVNQMSLSVQVFSCHFVSLILHRLQSSFFFILQSWVELSLLALLDKITKKLFSILAGLDRLISEISKGSTGPIRPHTRVSFFFIVFQCDTLEIFAQSQRVLSGGLFLTNLTFYDFSQLLEWRKRNITTTPRVQARRPSRAMKTRTIPNAVTSAKPWTFRRWNGWSPSRGCCLNARNARSSKNRWICLI